MRHKSRFFLFPRCLLFFVFITVSLCGCGSSKTSEAEKFDLFLEDCFKEMVSDNTVSLHFKLSSPEKYGLSDSLPATFSDFSYEKQKADCKRSAELLETLNSFSSSELSEEQKLTWDIFKTKLEQNVASEKYILYQSLLGSDGLPSQIPVTLSEYYFNNENDVKTYLSLMNQIPDVFERLLAYEEERRDAGMPCPDYLITDTLEQIDQFISGTAEDNLLTETFRERIQNVPELSNDQKTTYIHNNRSLFEQVVLPAYQSLRSSLEGWIGTGTKKERLCQYENGQDYYRLLLLSRVGTNLSPEQCITVLEEQLQGTVKNVSELLGKYPNLSSDYLTAEPEYTEPQQIFDELKTSTLLDFPELTDVDCSLKEVPSSLAGTSASAFYLVPPIDSTDANVIYINNNRVNSRDMFSTLAHEGYPGHLYQTNYYQKMCNPVPLRSLLRTEGYDEGWGTYAQLYSYQFLNFKDTDEKNTEALRKLHQNNDLFSLSLSALSDLYVNYKNYDRDTLEEYLKKYGITEESVSSIYQYVTENPVSYLSYCMGYYEFMQLRNNMEEALGDSFDIKEFHRIILDTGSCPFPLLKKELMKKCS